MMVKAIKQGAHKSAHTLSQFLLYFIFLCFNFRQPICFVSGILLWTPCSYTLHLKCSECVFCFVGLGFIFCFRYCSYQECWFYTADQTVFKSDGKGRGPGEKVSAIVNLKSKGLPWHVFFMYFFIFFNSWMSLTNCFDVEVWRSWKFGEG